MNRTATGTVLVLLIGLLAGTSACVSSHKLPVIDGKETVAMVNGEPITREEYEREISSLHAQMMEDQKNPDEKAGHDQKQPGKVDYAGLLKRMVDARLIVQEGKRIGLNDLPEVKEAVANYSQGALRTLLMKQAVKDVKPDEELVKTIYEKSVREWKFGSLMFPKEKDAKKMEAAVRAGGDFSALAAKAIADKKARHTVDQGYLSGDQLYPQIYDALLSMGTGSVSGVIPVPGGFALVKLEDARRQETQEKKDAAVQEAIREKKSQDTSEFIETMKKKYAKTDTKVLESVDLDTSVEEFEKLLKDERVVVHIGDDDRITVGDLTSAVQRKFFHGIERVIGKKDLNAKKYDVLDQMIESRVLVKEALKEGIDKTEAYRVLANTYENSLVFGMFVQKVVIPDIKVTGPDIKAYYESHKSDYTSPEKMKLDGVVFKTKGDAEKALTRLRAGDQLEWIKANAVGQVEKDADGLMELNGNMFVISTLDEGLKAALSGAVAGNSRLYESPEGYFYIVSVIAVYPPVTEDYQAVREMIGKQLFHERVRQGIADWVEKLRANATVKVYLEV